MEEFFSLPFYWIRTNWLFSHLAERTYPALKSFFARQQGAWPRQGSKMVHIIVLTLEEGVGEKALFIISREPYFKPYFTVSGWVKEAICGAYSHLTGKQGQQIGKRAMISKGFRPHGQVWPACHSKRLWMLR